MKLKDVVDFLEQLAPLSMQESYDNAGLLLGNPETPITGVLLCLDCTEEVITEAKRVGANLIIAHHPLIFKGLKSITGHNYVERNIISCIQNELALYAIHTNLDSYRYGVNDEICRRLGLQNTSILSPRGGVLNKLTVFIPSAYHEPVSEALFKAGAGAVGMYDQCHFYQEGMGTFRPLEDAKPFIGLPHVLTKTSEIRAEFLVSAHKLGNVIKTLKATHPYEEVAYDVYPLKNSNQTEGSGMIGTLPEPMDETAFLQLLKETFHCGSIRHTKLPGKKIQKVAVCGGSGSFLLNDARKSGADIFITADVKYHDFFDADGEIIIADIGHYESEQFTPNLLETLLKKKFTTFAIRLTEINTNPINYF